MAQPDTSILESRFAHELAGFVTLIGRLRTAALVLLTTLGLALWWAGDGGWRLIVLALAGCALVASLVLEGHDPKVTPALLVRRVGTVFLLHTAIIATTGCVESPVLPVFVPVSVVLAVAIGRKTWAAVAAGVLSVTVLVLLALRLTGVAEMAVPNLIRIAPTSPSDPLFLVTTALVMTLILTVGASIGLVLRQHLDRAATAVAEARAETLATLKAQHDELGELSSALAHELKNPLAAIHTLSDLVARKLAPGSREAEQMGVLVGEVRRLGGILDEFLNLSRPVRGLAAVDVEPAQVVGRVARLYEATAAARGVTLEVDVDAAGPLRCDPRKVQQVLINLVENALHALGAGGRLWLGARAVGDGVAFTVRDDGPGLPKEPCARLFESGVTTRADGSGLGLTVARAIAAQHGGELTLGDADGGGALATLTLPRHPPALEDAP